MSLISDIYPTLLPGKVLNVQVGISRTVVLVQTSRGLSCGLAATVTDTPSGFHCHTMVKGAGHLLEMSTRDLVGMADSESPVEVSIGIAAVNALAPVNPADCVELNAEDYLRETAQGKNVALIGHFPFVDRLRPELKNLWVLELEPHDGDLPADRAPEFVPQADVVAITATTLINHTLEGLLALCRPGSKVMLLGPSTPLVPALFDRGVDVLCGALVTDPDAAITAISQGASHHQLHHSGVTRYVTLKKS